MAEDLGEVRVQIEQEGAQDAANTIGEAAADAGDEGGGGGMSGGGGAGVGGLLGGISTKLAGILGFVAILATLKPIKELLSGFQRLLSVAVLPLVALLNAFLKPILQRLLRFIGGLDFDNLTEELLQSLAGVLQDFADAIVNSFRDALFGTDTATDQERDVAEGTAEGGIMALSTFTGGGLGSILGPGIAEQITSADRENVIEAGRQTGRGLDSVARNPSPFSAAIDFVSEQSPSVFDQGLGETVSTENQRNRAGSE